jgi:hypothetical protein
LRHHAILCIAFLLSASHLFSQDAGEAQGPFIIASVGFQVQGRTLASALRSKLEAEGPVVGRSFPDRASLDAFVADRKQVLLNNRVLASVEPSLEITPSEGGGSDVAISFAIVDTQNLIALPEPKYDSNTGLTLYLKGRDYDFLGSMQTLDLDLSYVSEAADNRYFEIATDFFLPFRALGADWNFGYLEDAAVWTQGIVKSNTAASLAYGIPGLSFPARIKAIGGLFYNSDLPETSYTNPGLTPYYSPLYEPDPWYLSGILAANAVIPLALKAGPWGRVSFTPKLSLTANWWPYTELSYPTRQGVAPAIEGSLSAGRVDWQGNFQAGGTVSLSALGTYYAAYPDTVADLELKLEQHWAWGNRIGVSARLVALDRLAGSPDMTDIGEFLSMNDLGLYLRGVIDARVQGIAGGFVNLQVPIKLFDFPTHAIIKKDWLDFELQAAPFVDAAIVQPDRSSSLSSNWLWYAGGLEFLVYPKIFHSFMLRVSIGWDLANVARTGSLSAKTPDGYSPWELVIGTQLMTDPIQTTYVSWVEN